MVRKEATRKIVRPLRGGQLTIPVEFRQQLGIDHHTLLEVRLAEGELRIRPVKLAAGVGASAWAKELYKLFAPVRKGMAKHRADEIDAEIEKAVTEVRERRGRP